MPVRDLSSVMGKTRKNLRARPVPHIAKVADRGTCGTVKNKINIYGSHFN